MEIQEIQKQLRQEIENCKKNKYFLQNPNFNLFDIPYIIEKMYSISGLLHSSPDMFHYNQALARTGYICTYKDCPVPEGIIPKYKDERTGNYYHVNASFNAYGMFIRDFTHDLNAMLYAFNEFYKKHKEDSNSYPTEFIREYALYLQPFFCTVLNCAEHLLNGDEYEGEPLYYSRYYKKEGLYKTYYLKFDCIDWEDKKIYVYQIPVFNSKQVTQKFIWKTKNYFERL